MLKFLENNLRFSKKDDLNIQTVACTHSFHKCADRFNYNTNFQKTVNLSLSCQISRQRSSDMIRSFFCKRTIKIFHKTVFFQSLAPKPPKQCSTANICQCARVLVHRVSTSLLPVWQSCFPFLVFFCSLLSSFPRSVTPITPSLRECPIRPHCLHLSSCSCFFPFGRRPLQVCVWLLPSPLAAKNKHVFLFFVFLFLGAKFNERGRDMHFLFALLVE